MNGACCSCEEIRRIMEGYVEDIAHIIPAGKTKRAPSAYNLWMKECIPKRTGPIQERFKACAGEYKKQK